MSIRTFDEHGRSWSLDIPPDIEASTIGKHIAESGRPYEWPLLEYIRSHAFAGVAVDVGASIGNHSLYLALVCDLDVVAFEPATPDVLAANVARNAAEDRVRVEPVALGAHEGRAKTRGVNTTGLAHDPDAGWETWGYIHKLDQADDGNIPVRTLDSYELEDVGLVKIDVEGMEADVLEGAIDTIRRCRPAIFCEALRHDEHLAIRDVLAPLGYQRTERFKRGTPVERWDPR